MTWRDLLQMEGETVIAPWLGGRDLRLDVRKWHIRGSLPSEHGWYKWKVSGRTVSDPREVLCDWEEALPRNVQTGFLVGDVLVGQLTAEHVQGGVDALREFPHVRLLPPGLDYFSRIVAASAWCDGPLLFVREEFPVGPEDELRSRYVERGDIQDISGVPPQLELAFRLLVWQRQQVEARREQLRREREREESLRRMRDSLGDGQMRRELARTDFRDAAQAALAVGGAELLDTRPSTVDGEHVVQYRVDGSRYECVCDQALHVVDAGICLTDEHTGEKGDTYFTLESLPSVIREAISINRLVVWRHV